MRILMFHGVGSDDYPAPVLERHLKWLAAVYDIVSIEEALEGLASGRKPRRSRMLLTFDDGLQNNAEIAYPALARLGLRAVFYVCPGLIESRRWLWNHEARERLTTLPAVELGRLAAELGVAADGVEPIVDWMKGQCRARTDEVCRLIAERTPRFEPTPQQRRRFDLMTWQQLGALDPCVVTVGSHTVSHPILTGLDTDALEHELAHSRDWLQQRLRRPVEHFCFPNGSTDPTVRAVAVRHYRSAVSTEPGYAKPGDDVHHLRRIGAIPQWHRLFWRLHRRYASVR